MFLTYAPNTDDPYAYDYDASYTPNATYNDAVSTYSKNPNIHWEKAINISKITTTPKTNLKTSLMPTMVMLETFLTMMLLITPILMTIMLDPQTPKYTHIH